MKPSRRERRVKRGGGIGTKLTTNYPFHPKKKRRKKKQQKQKRRKIRSCARFLRVVQFFFYLSPSLFFTSISLSISFIYKHVFLKKKRVTRVRAEGIKKNEFQNVTEERKERHGSRRYSNIFVVQFARKFLR